MSSENDLELVIRQLKELTRHQNYEEQLKLVDKWIPIALERKDQSSYGYLLNQKGIALGGLEKLHEAIKVTTEAIVTREQFGDFAGVGISYDNLANYYSNLFKEDEARKAYNKAIELTRKYCKPIDIAITLFNYASFLRERAEVDEALDLYTEAAGIATISQSSENDELLALIDYQISDLYIKREEWKQAQYYAERSLTLSLKLSRVLSQGQALTLLVTIASGLNRYEEALSYAEKAESALQDYAPIWTAYLLASRAHTHHKLGNIAQATQDYEDAIAKSQREFGQGDDVLSSACAGYSRLLLETGHVDTALDQAQRAYEKSLTIDRPDLNFLLSDIYEARGEMENSLRHLKKAFAAYKDLSTRAIDRKLTNLKHKHELELERSAKELAQVQTAKLESELSSTTIALLTQTELLSNFREDLRDIVKRIPPTEPAVRELKEKLKELPCQSINWERFETQFRAVHPEFTKKLYEQFPALTPTETKMCSLLRLNLKSHEIARLFCLSERSVETHRFNIRRKLKLGHEQNLVTFLNSL